MVPLPVPCSGCASGVTRSDGAGGPGATATAPGAFARFMAILQPREADPQALASEPSPDAPAEVGAETVAEGHGTGEDARSDDGTQRPAPPPGATDAPEPAPAAVEQAKAPSHGLVATDEAAHRGRATANSGVATAASAPGVASLLSPGTTRPDGTISGAHDETVAATASTGPRDGSVPKERSVADAGQGHHAPPKPGMPASEDPGEASKRVASGAEGGLTRTRATGEETQEQTERRKGPGLRTAHGHLTWGQGASEHPARPLMPAAPKSPEDRPPALAPQDGKPGDAVRLNRPSAPNLTPRGVAQPHPPQITTPPQSAHLSLPLPQPKLAGDLHAFRFGFAWQDHALPVSESLFAEGAELRPGSLPAASESLRAEPLRADLARHATGQLASALRAATATASGTPGQFDIDLSPAELGRVRISMSFADGGLLVAVQADRPETQDLLRRHIDHLRDLLADTGHESISFAFGGDGRSRQNPANLPPLAASGGEDTAAMQAAAQTRAPPTREGGLDMRL